jgi:acetyltransferase
MKRDPSFWDVLIVWLWWIYVNVFEDIQMALAPVSRTKIVSLLKWLHSVELLKWTRWQWSIDFEKLSEQIYRIQIIFQKIPEIREIDINPLFVNGKEAIIVDAKFYV